MLRIAICDDESRICGQIKDYTHRLCNSLGADRIVYIFSNALELLNKYPNDLDVLFLDIQMGSISGMEAARIIRNKDHAVKIIFMTNHAGYAVEGYAVQAYRYLLKPVTYMRFQDEVKDALVQLISSKEKIIQIKNPEGIFRVLIKNILYIETCFNKRLSFHVTERILDGYGTMSQLEKDMAEYRFFRCHTSYLVNLDYISEVRKDYTVLANGDKLPVSKHRKKDFLKVFTDYAGDLL